MKKLTISVAILLGGVSAKAQTEYVELSSNELFKRSYAKYYNDSGIPLEKDLEVSIVKGKLNYHWVEYKNSKKVVIVCSDKKYTYRKICVNDYCYIYNTNNQVYKFNLTGNDSLKFYKPVFNQNHLENE
tara:strand:- start:184 stop:570 length:387 start_codon:yes stop_codon:yes gene_type:complete